MAIQFDDDFRIRVWDSLKFKEAEELSSGCRDFADRVEKFNVIVETFVETVEKQAGCIDEEKQKSIGMRNRVEGEQEHRRQKQQELKALINQRSVELDRLTAQADALAKIESQQREIIERTAEE